MYQKVLIHLLMNEEKDDVELGTDVFGDRDSGRAAWF